MVSVARTLLLILVPILVCVLIGARLGILAGVLCYISGAIGFLLGRHTVIQIHLRSEYE